MRNCLFLTVARVKALFGYLKDKLDELIKFVKSPSGAHTEETSEGIQEAELDDTWDLNAAEDAPIECLAAHEEENDGSE
jgi:hypothetical protein